MKKNKIFYDYEFKKIIKEIFKKNIIFTEYEIKRREILLLMQILLENILTIKNNIERQIILKSYYNLWNIYKNQSKL